MIEFNNFSLSSKFKDCHFMTKGAEGCQKGTIYAVRHEKKIIKLCKPCVEICQNHPEYSEADLIDDMGKEFVCECAENNHELIFMNEEEVQPIEDIDIINELPCPFTLSLNRINCKSFFIE